jgi:hypothetical protein
VRVLAAADGEWRDAATVDLLAKRPPRGGVDASRKQHLVHTVPLEVNPRSRDTTSRRIRVGSLHNPS